jgi:hypothetical protein
MFESNWEYVTTMMWCHDHMEDQVVNDYKGQQYFHLVNKWN